jgi:hypothetical protein
MRKLGGEEGYEMKKMGDGKRRQSNRVTIRDDGMLQRKKCSISTGSVEMELVGSERVLKLAFLHLKKAEGNRCHRFGEQVISTISFNSSLQHILPTLS